MKDELLLVQPMKQNLYLLDDTGADLSSSVVVESVVVTLGDRAVPTTFTQHAVDAGNDDVNDDVGDDETKPKPVRSVGEFSFSVRIRQCEFSCCFIVESFVRA